MRVAVVILLCVACWYGCLLPSVSSQQPRQSYCENGRVSYPCPTVRDEFNRWGITIRSFYNPPTLESRSVRVRDPDTVVDTAATLWANLSSYLAGGNVDKTVFPLMMPRTIHISGSGSGSIRASQPLPYSADPPPESTVPGVDASSPEYENTTYMVLWWHDKPTDGDLWKYRNQLMSIFNLHTRSVLSDWPWVWQSWTGPGSDEWYNEINIWIEPHWLPPLTLALLTESKHTTLAVEEA